MSYEPKTIDTSGVDLPEILEPLIERLTDNSHNTWAKQRIKDGWTYGPKRDDDNKKHPCLVPTNELPAEELEYDRITVVEVLKAIQILGYDIVPRTWSE